MIFKDNYTTTIIKEAVLNDKDKTAEEKDKESKKTIVSSEAYLNAEMMEELGNKLEKLRISGLIK